MIKIRHKKIYDFSSWLNWKIVVMLLAIASLQFSAIASGANKSPLGIKITGTIVSSSDQIGMPGVSVLEKGTKNGTITDLNGKFSLEVASPNSVLVISFIGFETQEIAVGDQTSLNISLKEKSQAIDEVVVVGYGTAKKRDITGSTVTVGKDAIKASIGANVDQALQGRAAGVTVVANSGQPGSSISIAIRGQSTINAGAQDPLYVVDGVPMGGTQSSFSAGLGGSLGNGSVSTISPLSSINPADIESMEILKDASATAIFGSRGSNGVILITTKSGKSGEAKFSYEYYTGVQEQMKRLDVMNLRDFAKFNYQYNAETSGRDPRVEFQDPSILGTGTNWQNAVFRVAPMQSHQLSARGGTDKISYSVSGSYFKQDGTVIGSDFNRYTAMAKVDANLNKWLKLGTKFDISTSNQHIGLNNSTEGIISLALRTTPDIAIYNTDGSYAGNEREGVAGSINPIAQALDLTNTLKNTSMNGLAYLDLNFTKDLTLHSEVSVNLGYQNGHTFTPTYVYGTLVNTVNSVSTQYNQNAFIQFKNYLTYKKTIDKHNLTMMLGQESSENKWEYLSGYSTGLSSNDIQEPGLGDPTTMKVNSGKGSSAMVSFYARANYDFDSKYLLTYTFRRDGSSNFGPNNRWAPFNSIGLSWRINNEEFMKSYSTISNLKLRTGWGQTGNANIGGYKWGAAISKMPTGLGQGYRQANIENKSIQWEKQEQYNLGIDYGMFGDRLTFVADLYSKKSKGMLMSMQMPSYMGTSGNASARLDPPMGNYGEIENKGLELTIGGRPFVGDFAWETNFNISFNKNKLLGLNDVAGAQLLGYGQWTDVVSVSKIGDPLYSFYGYKVAGIYKDKADIENSPKPKSYPSDGNYNRTNTVWVGDIKYQDLSGPDGKPDGKIDEYDRTNIGSPLPIFTYGFNNTFRYKNFELNVFVSGSYGNKVMNYVGRSLNGMENMWTNQLSTVVNHAQSTVIDANKAYPFVDSHGNTISAWFNDIDNVQVLNTSTGIPRAIAGDPNENRRISDRYIEDGSYIRIKNVSLAYNFPDALIKKAKLQSVKIYTSVQNLYTFTKYNGFDPEIGASQMSDNVYGLDNGRYPSPRIITFGANITF